MKQKKQRNLEQKRNPLLNEAIRQKSYQYISKFQQQGNALVERISKQDQLDLMMTILDKECEERSNLEVHILTHIVSDIRFFRDIKSSATDADETCFKLCKYMQGFFLSKDQVLFNQGDRGDTFWIIIKGEVRIYKSSYQKVEEQQSNDQENSQKQAGKQQENANEEMQLQEIELVRLGQGNCFGEFALDPNKSNRRQASVQTTVDTFFGFIKGDKIIDILEKIKNSASFIESFSKMSILSGYPYEVIKQFYDISDEQKVEKNSIIYDVGDIPDNFYFIKEGEFSIYIEKSFNNQFKEVKKQSQSKFFHFFFSKNQDKVCLIKNVLNKVTLIDKNNFTQSQNLNILVQKKQLTFKSQNFL
ncbi:cyclic nucleotide-binding domain protein (macronuclear) [Tetrahymena thermophila SB210]|uniref:Cyclic nucleotide-binding domain protein n=1 Tax=Tetrahymena thermophila (strain SB210) TaxID=312017 RepID=Q239J3_TETTS|nr:cyclic nucleotide-binding domain protein [Tetrahymena thermophila SB210]EAR93197.2 cyclic nucleotide-binding domain protein [Tetrahymena thermophila SB210]|eukprot:XP_001013442.2 cyclic nucleotide-binding domain protein [Tetrahymena thermophila SB210]